MACQRDLEAAAEGGAAERSHDGLAQLLEATELVLGEIEGVGDGRVLGRAGVAQQLEISAGEEGILRRGDDDAVVRVAVGLEPVDRLLERLTERSVHGVGGLCRIVDRQYEYSVAADLAGDRGCPHSSRCAHGCPSGVVMVGDRK